MQARRLPARHGLLWLMAGFRIFRGNPPLLTALTLAYLFLIVVINLLPWIGPFLVPLALPALAVVLANGCRAVEQGRSPGTVQLIQGIKAQRVPLVRLGGLHLLASIAILVINASFEGGRMSMLGDPRTLDEDQMLVAMARLLVIAAPILAGFWFAPLLTAWDGVAPMKAVFFSFVASWRNWRAFAGYILMVALVAVAIPGLIMVAASAIAEVLFNVVSLAMRMILIFVLAPTLVASMYVSYRDVFHGGDEAA